MGPCRCTQVHPSLAASSWTMIQSLYLPSYLWMVNATTHLAQWPGGFTRMWKMETLHIPASFKHAQRIQGIQALQRYDSDHACTEVTWCIMHQARTLSEVSIKLCLGSVTKLTPTAAGCLGRFVLCLAARRLDALNKTCLATRWP